MISALLEHANDIWTFWDAIKLQMFSKYKYTDLQIFPNQYCNFFINSMTAESLKNFYIL